MTKSLYKTIQEIVRQLREEPQADWEDMKEQLLNAGLDEDAAANVLFKLIDQVKQEKKEGDE